METDQSYDRQQLEQLRDHYREQLLENILPFWLNHALDEDFGGFLTSLDRDGTVVDTDKSVWAQGRFTWMLGKLYNSIESPDTQWLDTAKSGAKFLLDHCFDSSDGRMWFHVTQKGIPIRKRRYAFTESFAAIAFGELALATGEQRYRTAAENAFRQFVDHNLAEQESPKFTGNRPVRSIGFPMILIVTAQQLRNSIELESANHWIDFSIDLIRRYHMKPEKRCVFEMVGHDGQILDHFDGRTLNPGHAIEAAWFLMAEGVERNDSPLIETGCEILDWMWEWGWDQEYGGILYFVSSDNKPIQEYWQDMKFWWPHNETIIATLLAYLLTDNPKYAKWHGQVHQWSLDKFADETFGEWFGYLRRDGSISNTLKGNLWKGPFHLPRMQFVCWQIVENHLKNQALFAPVSRT